MKVYHSQNRKAEILFDNYCYVVRLWEDNKHIEDRQMKTKDVVHSLHYAEDCAINWVDHVF